MWFLIFALIFCEVSLGQRYQHDPSAIYFPGPISRRGERIYDNSSSTLRSLQIARRMNSLHTVEEYLKYVDDMPMFTLLESRFSGSLRAAAVRPTLAYCMPENRTVPLIENPDPTAVYIPECTRVKRCGGCCTHKLLACEPSATRLIDFEITVATINYSDDNKPFRFKSKIRVPIEEHTECKCVCAVKAEHCNEKQEYLPRECRCQCKNLDEKEKCITSDVRKTWNPELCVCQCQEIRQCPSNYYFDSNTCSCKEIEVPPWVIGNSRTGYNFRQTRNSRDKLPVIISLDASDPRRQPTGDPE